MSQTSIATKYTVTATTGTAGTTFDVAGRDNNGNVTYRAVIDAAVPKSDTVLTVNSRPVVKGWNSTLKLDAPSMKTIASGDSSGFVAGPEVAGRMILTMKVSRDDLVLQSTALRQLDQLLYSLLTDAKLRASVVGYTPADA